MKLLVGGGSWGPLDPNFLHVNKKSRFQGGGGEGVKDPTIWRSRFNFCECKWLILVNLGPFRVNKGHLG